MKKRLTKSVLTGLVTLFALGMTVTPVFAAIPNGTVIFGDGEAFDLNYANSTANLSTIQNEVINNHQIWVNTFNGTIVDNATGYTVPASVLPIMKYYNGSPVIPIMNT